MTSTQDLEEHIRHAISQVKEIHGLTIVELSKRTGIEQARLGNIIRGDRTMRADELALLMVVLQIPIKAICPVRFIPCAIYSELRETLDKLESGE